ncbi:hypothetical protein CDL12_21741 [Handroanthus impetiginosus]|uniref:RING-type domain-containing protein n=1 Tax=Handroanthus impetiginosus TaxID=429701 RepID=A0A2G9GKH8_9LAMI|nr:hypothetical protein CDL12_21741 [Handroanthus impetiginosus]
MATLSQLLANIYTIIMVFFSILLFEIAIFIRTIARITIRRSITTDRFLKIINEKAPAQRYKTGLGFEPLECRVCLSIYEEGDEVRKLKCKHTFHKGCLDTWLQQESATCPLCRTNVLPEDVVVKHRRHRSHEYHEYYDESDEEFLLLLYALHGNFLRRFL